MLNNTGGAKIGARRKVSRKHMVLKQQVLDESRNNIDGANFSQHTACIGQPAKDRPGPPIRSADAALVERLRQGTRESDGQERADRLTSSLMALGLYCTEEAYRWSGQTFTGHPAAAMGALDRLREVWARFKEWAVGWNTDEA